MPSKPTKLRPRSRAHLISVGVVCGLLRPASLWLLSLPTWPVAVSAQQDTLKACNLLTSTELTAAIGGSVSHPTGIFSPKNQRLGRNGDFWSCEETVGTHKVWIFYDTLPVTEEGKKLTQEMQDRLRKQGYEIQTKELNGSLCSTVFLPSGSKNTLAGTNCGRDKGPYHVLVKVEASGSSDLTSMEKVASLLEKAAARVPSQ